MNLFPGENCEVQATTPTNSDKSRLHLPRRDCSQLTLWGSPLPGLYRLCTV